MKKINIKTLFIVLLITTFMQMSFAQKSKITVLPLDSGDTMPDIKLAISNYVSPFIRFQDLKGKLVILDFWNVHCANCILAMPEVQALQNRFKDHIQVILVTTDSVSQVQALSRRSKIVDTIRLPSIMQDSTLLRLFKIRTVPTHVWISPEGKIAYITEGYNTSGNAIGRYLNGGRPQLAIKRELMDIDFEQPLWLEGNGRHRDKLLYYSYITSQIQTSSSIISVKPDRKTRLVTNIKAINVAKLNLFQIALGRSAFSEFNLLNRVILNVHDPQTYLWPAIDDRLDFWKAKNLYCYEMQVKPEHADQIFDLMKQELENFFKVNARIKMVYRPCWVLIKKTKKASKNNQGKVGPSISIGQLIQTIQLATEKYTSFDLPILDETKIVGKINLQISNDTSTIESLRSQLNAGGLDIWIKKRKINMLVISDRK